jgi:hypothetical protein
MSEIKKTIERYDWELDEYMVRAHEADDGYWVAYEDVADLITENERLRAKVERLRETNERLREAAEDALWFIGTEYDRVGLHKAGKSWRSTKDGAAYKLRAALKEDGR